MSSFSKELSELLDKHMALQDSNKELIEVLANLNVSLDAYWNGGRTDSSIIAITEYQKKSSEVLTKARRL